MIDDIDPDHIGWLLFQANQDWTLEFVDRMQAAGHGWFTGARSTLMGHIAPRGTKQGLLVDRIGISKQAVQDANRIKRELEATYRLAMGEADFARLTELLGKLRLSRRNPVA